MVNFRYNGYPCHVEGCKKTGLFGFAAGRALLCGYHKTVGMISGRKCVEPGCPEVVKFTTHAQREVVKSKEYRPDGTGSLPKYYNQRKEEKEKHNSNDSDKARTPTNPPAMTNPRVTAYDSDDCRESATTVAVGTVDLSYLSVRVRVRVRIPLKKMFTYFPSLHLSRKGKRWSGPCL